MTLRRLGWAAALGLIVALASVVFYGAGKTHICPVYLWVSFDDHEAITTLSPGGLFGGRMAAPPGRHRPGHSRAEVFYAIHDAIRLLDDDAAGCWATTQRGYHCCRSGCQDMLRRHVVAPGVLSLCMHFSTSFLVNTSGRAQGCCCGGVLRGQRGHHCWRSYWCSQAFKTHATISSVFFGVFFFCRSPCCVVSSVLSPKQRRFCLFAPPLVGLSVMNKGTDFYVSRLRVCCSMVLSFTLPIASSLYSSLADFCSGERRLFLSLRRRNHLVSDVDRRETGLFPRKTKTSLSGSFFSFFKKNIFEPCSSCTACA